VTRDFPGAGKKGERVRSDSDPQQRHRLAGTPGVHDSVYGVALGQYPTAGQRVGAGSDPWVATPNAGPATVAETATVAKSRKDLTTVRQPGTVDALPPRVRPEGNLRVGRLPEGSVYVGRQCFWLRRSPYFNPHVTSDNGCRECDGQVHTRAEAVEAYRDRLRGLPALVERARRELVGQPLACWCPIPTPGEPDICHAAVLIAVVAGEEP
jgi:hypothetical protein